MKRENEGLNGRMKEMKRTFDEDRRRMLEDHENSARRLGQEERQRAAEERRALVEEYEGKIRQLKEGWEQAVAKTGRELVETRTRLMKEHSGEVERLKEANWDLETLTTTMAEDHKVAKKKWEDEKKALKAEWDNERSALTKEREQASKVHNELNRLLESEKADQREFKSSVDKTFEEMRVRTSNELAKSNEALRRKREQVSELDSRLQRVREEVNDLKVWQTKAREVASEAARLRKAVQKMAGQTDGAVFEDQARRQASADIRFSRPSTSRRGSGSADAIEPVDAALSVLYALNSEIFQAAASLADTIEGSAPPAGLVDTIDDFGTLMEKVAPFLSEELVVSLRSAYAESSDGPNPLILQVAFQACLAYSCNRFITSWYPIHWEYGRFLEVMHGRLIDAGAIPEADSFRSTTRAVIMKPKVILAAILNQEW
ncbi:hypothetical protein FA13DRAFT_714985 [Coprinellus micaceus]|uniref:Uncharacterized protein n=1 Tax=Coprinellus micaceus TaxID=71717 RepID=A0A4Y7TVL3_COPMI|nr:hypothetical protein FA13DRAFT_714985 [Coprinellus micaceus]